MIQRRIPSMPTIQNNVEHSKYYKNVKKWYELGKWPLDVVREAVNKGWITEAEYAEITGLIF